MPTKINVVFDNFNIQTWKKILVSFKMYTWFTEKKNIQKKQQKNRKKIQNICENRIWSFSLFKWIINSIIWKKKS